MADARRPAFAAPTAGVLILFCEEGLKLGPASRKALEPTGDQMKRAAAADRFTGKNGSALERAGVDAGRPRRDLQPLRR